MLNGRGITEKEKDLANMHIVYLYQNKERVLIQSLFLQLPTPYSLCSQKAFLLILISCLVGGANFHFLGGRSSVHRYTFWV